MAFVSGACVHVLGRSNLSILNLRSSIVVTLALHQFLRHFRLSKGQALTHCFDYID